MFKPFNNLENRAISAGAVISGSINNRRFDSLQIALSQGAGATPLLLADMAKIRLEVSLSDSYGANRVIADTNLGHLLAYQDVRAGAGFQAGASKVSALSLFLGDYNLTTEEIKVTFTCDITLTAANTYPVLDVYTYRSDSGLVDGNGEPCYMCYLSKSLSPSSPAFLVPRAYTVCVYDVDTTTSYNSNNRLRVTYSNGSQEIFPKKTAMRQTLATARLETSGYMGLVSELVGMKPSQVGIETLDSTESIFCVSRF